MWTVRIILLGALAALVGTSGYLIKHRRRYERLLKNTIFNIILVIAYQVLCCLIVVLPSARNGIAAPNWLESWSVRIGFYVVGPVLICSGIVLAITTLARRKAIGGQDVKEGLIMSGPYRHFRHPIYVGMIWFYLGLALLMRNVDGLLVLPALLALIVVQSLIEEEWDMGARFREQYEAYKRRTRMFGPIWLWGIVVFIIVVLVGLV